MSKQLHPIDQKIALGYSYQATQSLLDLQQMKFKGLSIGDVKRIDLELYEGVVQKQNLRQLKIEQDEFVRPNLEWANFDTDLYSYQGYMANSKKQGFGVVVQDKRRAFQGIFKNGKFSDAGIVQLHPNRQAAKKLHQRDFENFSQVEPNGVTYRGQFREGEINGVGEMKFIAQNQMFHYIGGFKKGKFHGKGKIIQNEAGKQTEWISEWREGRRLQ